MTKEEMISWLEDIIDETKDQKDARINKLTIMSMDLLASLKGWRVQRCNKVRREK